jgi:uncharacterized membrane protein
VAGRRITKRNRRAIDGAVRNAEASTGLQFCVYLGPASDDTRAHAESAFVEAGLHELPAVLLLVAPEQRTVEVVTAPSVRVRLPDDECHAAVQEMTQYFARNAFVEGLLVGINELAERAGPGVAPPGTTDLPNVLG